MVSASLSGISMLNSCWGGGMSVVAGGEGRGGEDGGPYLLNRHDNLDGVEAVEAQVVGKVCLFCNLFPKHPR